MAKQPLRLAERRPGYLRWPGYLFFAALALGAAFASPACVDHEDTTRIDYFHKRLPDPSRAPGAPMLSLEVVNYTTIDLSWTEADDAIGYKVLWGQDSAPEELWNRVFETSCRLYDLKRGSTYRFKVLAVNSFGATSSQVVKYYIAPLLPIAAPTGLAAIPLSTSQIGLKWTDNADNENGYAIERTTDPATVPFTQVDTVGINTRYFTDNGLAASTVYYYRVRAFNTAGQSGYSNEASATTYPPGFLTMALIPGGTFDMGDNLMETGANARPVHTVSLDAFWIDVYEVTNAEYAECVNAGVCALPYRLDSPTRDPYFGDPAYEDYPVIAIDWDRANTFCTWAGKRLPTEAEWEYAARGGLEGMRFAWGNTLSPDKANYWIMEQLSDHDTKEVGSYQPNGYGLYDMTGNMWEWVNDWYSETYYSESPVDNPTGPTSGTFKILRGGGWDSSPDDGWQNVSKRYYVRPFQPVAGNGIRCVIN